MKTHRRILTIALAALLGATYFAACKGEGEAFGGQISEKTFETQNAAVEAFLKDEIEGLSTQAELVGYQKEADLTADEIGKLPLGDGANPVDRAERGTVSYKVQAVANTAGLAAETDDVKMHALYLLETEGKFRYFVPPTEIGQPITKSYYNSLFAPEKYANCTLEMNIDQNFISSGQKASSKIVIKAAGDVAELNGNGSVEGSGYFAIKNGTLYQCEARADGSWEPAENSDFSGLGNGPVEAMGDLMGNMISHAALQGIDFSYFERTKNGLSIGKNKYVLAAAKLMNIPADFLSSFTNAVKNLQYDCVVQNDRIKEITVNANIDTTGLFPGAGSIVMELNTHYRLKDFGTTKVSLPDDLKAALDTL